MVSLLHLHILLQTLYNVMSCDHSDITVLNTLLLELSHSCFPSTVIRQPLLSPAAFAILFMLMVFTPTSVVAYQASLSAWKLRRGVKDSGSDVFIFLVILMPVSVSPSLVNGSALFFCFPLNQGPVQHLSAFTKLLVLHYAVFAAIAPKEPVQRGPIGIWFIICPNLLLFQPPYVMWKS